MLNDFKYVYTHGSRCPFRMILKRKHPNYCGSSNSSSKRARQNRLIYSSKCSCRPAIMYPWLAKRDKTSWNESSSSKRRLCIMFFSFLFLSLSLCGCSTAAARPLTRRVTSKTSYFSSIKEATSGRQLKPTMPSYYYYRCYFFAVVLTMTTCIAAVSPSMTLQSRRKLIYQKVDWPFVFFLYYFLKMPINDPTACANRKAKNQKKITS
jgi:hypothetical protein